MASLIFRALGSPQPQGSKTMQRNRKGDVVGLRESNATRLTPWRKTLADAAERAHRRRAPLEGALELWADFQLERPKSRRWQIWAPVEPDLDKLVRALGDALKVAGAIGDDGQIVRMHAQKLYPTEIRPWQGVSVRLEEIGNDVRQGATDLFTLEDDYVWIGGRAGLALTSDLEHDPPIVFETAELAMAADGDDWSSEWHQLEPGWWCSKDSRHVTRHRVVRG